MEGNAEDKVKGILVVVGIVIGFEGFVGLGGRVGRLGLRGRFGRTVVGLLVGNGAVVGLLVGNRTVVVKVGLTENGALVTNVDAVGSIVVDSTE